MAILKFVGTVSTNRVGSACRFNFEVDEEDLPDDPDKRRVKLDDIAQEAIWESGMVSWDYEQKP